MSSEPIYNISTESVTAAVPTPTSDNIVINGKDDDSLSSTAATDSGISNLVSETISIGSHSTSSSSLRYSYSINSIVSDEPAEQACGANDGYEIIDSNPNRGTITSTICAQFNDEPDVKSISSETVLLNDHALVLPSGFDNNNNNNSISKRKQSYVRLMAKRFEEVTDAQQINQEANFNECNWWLKTPSVTYLEDDEFLCGNNSNSTNDTNADDKLNKFATIATPSDFSTVNINKFINKHLLCDDDDDGENEMVGGVKSRILRLNQLSSSSDNLHTKKHFAYKSFSNSNYRYLLFSHFKFHRFTLFDMIHNSLLCVYTF